MVIVSLKAADLDKFLIKISQNCLALGDPVTSKVLA